MKIFITGATGFIGAHLVKRLSQTDHQIVCLVRKMNPASEELKKLGAALVKGDITDKASLLDGMKGCDWVMNLAGVYTYWEPRNRIYKEVNVDGTRNVMESALENKVSKVVHVSTVGVYGKPEDCPYVEESKVGSVRFGRYFQTKYDGELIAWAMYKNKGLPLVMVYPSAVLGPNDPKATGRYISSLVRRRMPATVFLEGTLTFVHVKDVAEAIVRAAEKEGNLGEKYFVGKNLMSFGELNQAVHEISGVPLPFINLPDAVTKINAALLTGLANVIKVSPPWGLSNDQIRIMKEGFKVDGSKAERELGLTYTPVREALEELVSSIRK